MAQQIKILELVDPSPSSNHSLMQVDYNYCVAHENHQGQGQLNLWMIQFFHKFQKNQSNSWL
jgi:hypothetical protein